MPLPTAACARHTTVLSRLLKDDCLPACSAPVTIFAYSFISCLYSWLSRHHGRQRFAIAFAFLPRFKFSGRTATCQCYAARAAFRTTGLCRFAALNAGVAVPRAKMKTRAQNAIFQPAALWHAARENAQARRSRAAAPRASAHLARRIKPPPAPLLP